MRQKVVVFYTKTHTLPSTHPLRCIYCPSFASHSMPSSRHSPCSFTSEIGRTVTLRSPIRLLLTCPLRGQLFQPSLCALLSSRWAIAHQVFEKGAGHLSSVANDKVRPSPAFLRGRETRHQGQDTRRFSAKLLWFSLGFCGQ